MDFDFPKTEKCSYHRFYSIYHPFLFYIFYHYIICQLYPLDSTATYNYMNKIVKK